MAKEYLTVKQLAGAYPAFPEGSVRMLLLNADKNGFNACVRRVGGKIVIDRGLFEEWVDGCK